ncbi:MAG TPA: endopeptidase La, partial [Myxococcota bacterium]|nr:endopeptidase La [Myxococcota bacterium]
LTSLDIAERLRLVIRLIAEAHTVSEVKQKIDSEVRREFSNSQREAVLREQLRAIRRELGEEGDGDRLEELKSKLDAAGLPRQARSVADRELRRLEAMGQANMEQGIITSYLQLLADLPWSKRAEVATDLEGVAAKLDADHFGLKDVKKRILEHLAVLKMRGNAKGTILCLAGPPGVGKTSLGRSIAEATGRPFVRVALGGIRDEAEIRGHRRTYVGALPGRILHALKTAGVKNPVFLLDEIDKLGQGFMGSPEAALLEVLDPEQNGTFQDHYLELPFDLSEVLFICTANALENLSAPLRDRLEIIEISGYTLEEKFHVARNHLMPKKLAEHALGGDLLNISDGALKQIIASYTREAGVRQLAQQITKLCRALTLKLARAPADTKPAPMRIEEAGLAEYLGKTRFTNEVAERTMLPGVATGLAWTPVGGDILFVETSRMHGSGKLEITGQLGDVMKESARAALTYVRSNAEALGVDPEFLSTQDLHIHVPAGGVPKDGPSAGVTIFTALTSLLTHRRVRPDTAMTGECTLRGRVLPVGGIKEKVLAAHRAGMTRVILPKQNQRDLDDVPESTQAAMEFIFAEDMSEVLASALASDAAPPLLPPSDDARHRPAPSV